MAKQPPHCQDDRDEAELPDFEEQVDGALADTYAARTGADRDAIAAMMDAETWLVGNDAVDQGFADAVDALPEANAQFDLSGFRNTPKTLAKSFDKIAAGREPTRRDLEMSLTQDAGLTRSKARALLRAGYPTADAMQDAGEAGFVAAFAPLLKTLTERTSP